MTLRSQDVQIARSRSASNGMRILHIVPSYYPAHRYGGPIQSVHNLNKDLVKQGADVTVYTTSADGSDDLQVPYGVPVDCDGVKVYYFKLGFLRPWFYSCTLHTMLAKTAKDFDIIHITSVFLFASTLGAYYAKKYKKPYIISPRGSLMKEPIMRKSSFLKRIYIACIEKYNLRNATIHFTADIEREEYLKLHLPLHNSFVIPNGLDVEKFDVQTEHHAFRDAFHISYDKRIVLFLGRISWKKGFDTLIPAFKKVMEENRSAILVIAGGDDKGYKKDVEKLVAQLKIINSVLFTGELLGDMKIAAFRESDVFVLPSYSENFGMAVVEAMSCELPVVITEGVGISKNIVRANAGIVIKKDEDELTHAILGVLDNKDAKEMGRRGKIFVQNEFFSKRVAQKFIATYNSLVNE